jgi:sugar/nucleoside kinase (ribokinase family)
VDELIGDGVDLLFSNEDEAKEMAKTTDLEVALDYLVKIARQYVVTRGPDGAVVYDGQKLHDIAPVPTRAIDTVGAGDMFAGAFLYGITHGMTHSQAGDLASRAASKIVASMGPRLKIEVTQAVLKQFLQKQPKAGS